MKKVQSAIQSRPAEKDFWQKFIEDASFTLSFNFLLLESCRLLPLTHLEHFHPLDHFGGKYLDHICGNKAYLSAFIFHSGPKIINKEQNSERCLSFYFVHFLPTLEESFSSARTNLFSFSHAAFPFLSTAGALVVINSLRGIQ